MFKEKRLLFLFLLSVSCYLPSALGAAPSKTGTTTATFLKIETGTRPVGMGGAFAAIADDVNAVSWNPGGLFQIASREAALTHTIWLEKLSHEYAALVIPVKEGRFSYGLSAVYLGTNDIDRRTDVGVSDGKARVQDYTIAAVCGLRLNDNLGVGAALKMLSMALDKNKGSTVIFDVGLLHKITSSLSLGVVGQNLGSKIEIDSTREKLPLLVKVGCAYKMRAERLIVSTDIDFPSDRELKLHLGSEYRFNEFFAMRAGYEDVGDLGNSSGISAGVSVYEDVLDEILNVKMKFDYSWLCFGDLGSTHRLAIGFTF